MLPPTTLASAALRDTEWFHVAYTIPYERYLPLRTDLLRPLARPCALWADAAKPLAESLPPTYDTDDHKAQFRYFIENYGTSYATSATLGGLVEQYSTFLRLGLLLRTYLDMSGEHRDELLNEEMEKNEKAKKRFEKNGEIRTFISCLWIF